MTFEFPSRRLAERQIGEQTTFWLCLRSLTFINFSVKAKQRTHSLHDVAQLKVKQYVKAEDQKTPQKRTK